MSDFRKQLANGAVEDGTYSQVLLEEHEGNPMIEALPPIFSKEKMMERVTNFPPFRTEKRELPKEVRVQIVRGLERIFVPLHRHYTLESEISTVLRMSYLDRNPLNSAFYWNHLSEKVNGLAERVTIAQQKGGMNYNPGGFKGSFFLCGMSGVGKTTALSRILSLYPQVVYHRHYRDQSFPFTQIGWLKVNCPHNSSVKGLCDRFFAEVDRVLKVTNYVDDYGGRTAPQMIPDVARVAGIHNTGLIVIDEVQNLSLVKSRGAKQMLAFFTELIDTCGCGIVLVGTERALDVLQAEFWQVRRNLTTRPFNWRLFDRGKTWDEFLASFWYYQYTKRDAELTDELGKRFHYETVGVPDLVVKLFIGAQQYAIESGDEVITSALVEDVAKALFEPAQGALAAFRRNEKGAAEQVSTALDEMKRQPARSLDVDDVKRSGPDKRLATKEKKQTSKGGKKRNGRKTTGLLSVFLEANEQNRSSYDALVQAGYIAPKDEFVSSNGAS